MKIYIVMQGVLHVEEWVLAIYKDKEKALARIEREEKENNGDIFYMNSWEVLE